MNVLTALTVLSIVIALAMTAVVLRLGLRERRRSAARVAALEADIYRTEDEDIEVLHDPASTLQQAPPPVFSPAVSDPGRPHRIPIAPLVAVAAAIALGAAIGATRNGASQNQSPRQHASASTAAQALELLSLDHERADDHFTVRGIVRNPAPGRDIDHLMAVVLVFNQQGGFLTSGRSPVESADLEPGAEAKFTVTLPGAADVGKYRVSFRTDDRVVPHVDRR